MWPITPKSFGDSKLIGYPTLLVGLFQFLPYEDWVVRLPAILAGSLLPMSVYFFSRTLGISKRFALLGALSIAVNPVFVHFSRFAYEAMVAVTLVVTATALLLYQAKTRSLRIKFDLLAAALFFFSLLTYNTPLLLMPFILLIVILHRDIGAIKKWGVTIGVLLATWLFALLLLFPMLSQKSGIAIFSDQTYIQNYPAYRASFSSIFQPLIGNQYVYYSLAIFRHFIASFSPQFLVLGGGAHPWHSLITYGHISWIVYFGAVASIISTLYHFVKPNNKRKNTRIERILFILLLFSLLPAVITVDAPHATRSLLFFILLVVASSQFFEQFLSRIRLPLIGGHIQRLLLTSLIIATLIGGTTFFTTYLRKYPAQANYAYQSGFPELITALDETYPNQPIAVVDPGGYQYILLAWYGNYSAHEFFQSIVKQQPNAIGLQYGERLGRYHFIVQASDRSDSESIIVAWEENNQQWQYQLL